ncbi:MAG: DUF4349 domain-containing protein [Bacteroidetes bacterium HGW-Bacteroidetes-2]|jgi:hypothetical protein|nr:MAG: DUF4349 domain-containing protein [Bacteroidetes bacterium HGW-Bacteroidetes-2]
MKVISYFIFSMILACGGDSASNGNTSYSVGMEEASMVSKNSIAADATVTQDQKIIQTGNLRFETKDLDKTQQHIQKVVAQNQGFIQEDNSGKNYNEVYRSITIRVPTTNFQSTIDSISKGVSFFNQKDISRQDVTEEFIDLEARLKAKRELENRYLELLKQAKNVTEMLEIERELSKIREEIEARQGRLNYLENRVSVSTISIYFYKITTDTGITTSYGGKMWNAVKSGWNGISMFFLGLIYIWPFLLILLMFLYLLRRYLRRKKQKI